jgi:hypothetical protein
LEQPDRSATHDEWAELSRWFPGGQGSPWNETAASHAIAEDASSVTGGLGRLIHISEDTLAAGGARRGNAPGAGRNTGWNLRSEPPCRRAGGVSHVDRAEPSARTSGEALHHEPSSDSPPSDSHQRHRMGTAGRRTVPGVITPLRTACRRGRDRTRWAQAPPRAAGAAPRQPPPAPPPGGPAR